MSNHHCSNQHVRALIDRAISESFAELEAWPLARLSFSNLLHHVRINSSLLRPTGDGSQQLLALEALRNIARHHDDFLVWPSTWVGPDASVHVLIHSLSSHLFGRYPVPRGFGQVWFGGNSKAERAPRRWFIEHAGGRRFRDIPGLPIKMTRKMEHILLSSPHHLPLRAAMRRAEILGLAPGHHSLVDAVLATPLAHDLEHGDFWRSALHYFVNHQDELDAATIGTLVDFLYTIRIRPMATTTAGGLVRTQPIEPSFSLTGRPLASVLSLCKAWKHDTLGPGSFHWPSSGLPSRSWEDALGEWRMLELLSNGALQIEGRTMRHCVASYWRACLSGRSSIWSLSLRQSDGAYASRCTIEVRQATQTIVQIRGPNNRPALGRLRTMIEEWAAHAGLTIPDYAW